MPWRAAQAAREKIIAPESPQAAQQYMPQCGMMRANAKRAVEIATAPLATRSCCPLVAYTNTDTGEGAVEADHLVLVCIEAAIHGAEKEIGAVAHADLRVEVFQRYAQ